MSRIYLNAPNLISTGKLNKIDLHVNTVDNELFHVESSMHKYNIKISDDDLTVLPCITGFKSGPSYVETDHLISKQELHISNTVKRFGHTGMLNHTNSAEQVGYEEYQSL